MGRPNVVLVFTREDDPATFTKLVGLETASVGLAADPTEGKTIWCD